MKRFLLIACGLLAAYSALLYTKGEEDLPPLKNGDLVFQTSWTDQSIAVGLATMSLYLHTGIIEQTSRGPMVIDAGLKVREIPLHDWIEGGILKRVSVYRYRNLSDQQGLAIVNAAKRYMGMPYDFNFLFDNGEIYCSELPYLAFREAGLSLGEVKKIGDLYINNAFSKKLIERRWQGHPQCAGKDITFEQCYDIIMAQTLVTPSSLAHDGRLELIFSNYP